MFITKKHLSRRTFLNGVGVTWRCRCSNRCFRRPRRWRRRRPKARTRLGCIYVPHGATMDKWTPATEGAGFELSEILQPLKPFQDRVNIISDLEPPAGVRRRSATANHNRSAATFLSGAHAEAGAARASGRHRRPVRRAADRPGHAAALARADDRGLEPELRRRLSCAYRDTISWQGPTSPLPMQNDPQVVFERLFGDGSTDAERLARRQQSVSLLDSVLGEASALQRRLPAGDREPGRSISQRRARDRAAHREGGEAGVSGSRRCRTRRSACRRMSKRTSS